MSHSSFLSFYTLLKKEVLRFVAVSGQTLLAPVITAGLYLLIFGVSLGSRISVIEGLSYIQYIVPGLILMGVINNSFANTSSSLFQSKFLGNIQDLLVMPVTPLQIICAYALAAFIRGLLVGAVIWGISLLFTDLPWVHPMWAFVMLSLSSLMFAQLGLIAAIYSNGFDQLSMFTNFLILPLIYLGGLFYPVSALPGFWAKISALNPMYYLIEGFRHAILGVGDVPIYQSASLALLASLFLSFWAARWIYSGYRLRS